MYRYSKCCNLIMCFFYTRSSDFQSLNRKKKTWKNWKKKHSAITLYYSDCLWKPTKKSRSSSRLIHSKKHIFGFIYLLIVLYRKFIDDPLVNNKALWFDTLLSSIQYRILFSSKLFCISFTLKCVCEISCRTRENHLICWNEWEKK